MTYEQDIYVCLIGINNIYNNHSDMYLILYILIYTSGKEVLNNYY